MITKRELLYKECTDEEWNKIIKIGNHMDMLLIELSDNATWMDYEAMRLESLLNLDLNNAFQEGSEFNSEKDVQDHIGWLTTRSRTLYDIIEEIKEAQAKDESSNLQVIYLKGDFNENE